MADTTSRYPYYDDLFQTARDPYRGKPLAHNTRLYQRHNGYAVQYHATDIVTFLPNGDVMLANRGWNTSTTLQRIRDYGTSHIFSDRGSWFVWAEEDENDPQPVYYDRSTPKPFMMADPGPMPKKTNTGWIVGDKVRDDMVCIAGTKTEDEYHGYETIHSEYFLERLSPQAFVTKRDIYESNDKLYHVNHVSGVERFYYGEADSSYQDEAWRSLKGGGHTYSESMTDEEGHTFRYKVCPHCKRFNEGLRAWQEKYDGTGWYRHNGKTWRVFVKMLAMFGDMEGWQNAYITEFRKRKEYLRLRKEWVERNTVPFYDGITVGPSGKVTRKTIKAKEREDKRRAREAAKRRREEATALKAATKARREALVAWGRSATVPNDDNSAENTIAWLVHHGVQPNPDGKTVTLYKGVNMSDDGKLISPHDNSFEYPIGEEISDPLYDGLPRCGGGLHFWPTIQIARNQNWGRVTIECEVELETLITILDKCKTRTCKVIRIIESEEA